MNFDTIWTELEKTPCDSELYYKLGKLKETEGNTKQAVLSYQQAVLYAGDTQRKHYEEALAALDQKQKMNHVSFILVTYNQFGMTRRCIDSIRKHNLAGTYEIIIVDNLSTDRTRTWLQSQTDIKYILNDSNKGFPAACNQGAAIAGTGNDIFLLNNDTLVMQNSVYNLRMALWENDRTGAAGACSNNAGSRQQVTEKYTTVDEYEQYADRNNCYNPTRNEKRMRLTGFALMIKYDAWNKVEGMDEIYGLGHFEDDDLCIALLANGYDVIFCKSSFIYHYGHSSFKNYKKENMDAYYDLLNNNKKIFNHKWNVEWSYFTHTRHELIEYIEQQREDSFSVLDIGCGAGATLLEIGNQYPNAELYGLELNKDVVSIAQHYLNIKQGNVENSNNPFAQQYDYIMCGDVLEHLHEPEKVLISLKAWLKPEGHLIISLPNVMHIDVIRKLLHGRFERQEQGILDRTHLQFYTLTEILEMLNRCALKLERMKGITLDISAENLEYMDMLCIMDSGISKEQLMYYQYILKVSPK